MKVEIEKSDKDINRYTMYEVSLKPGIYKCVQYPDSIRIISHNGNLFYINQNDKNPRILIMDNNPCLDFIKLNEKITLTFE